MPLELPTSASQPMTPPLNLKPAQQDPAGKNPTSTIIIQKDSVLTSVCEAVRGLSPGPAYTSQPASIELVLVPSAEQGTPINVAHIGPTTTTTDSVSKYKLSEIVSREKDVLFQSEKDPDVELVPAREDMFSVRHRSRQFFTLLEEDENDPEHSPAELVSGDGNKKEEKTIEVEPYFNLGDSLRKLYFPDQYKKKRSKRRKERNLKNKNTTSANRLGYESDPEGKIDLCKIISEVPELKQYKSHPELSQTDGSMLSSGEFLMDTRQSKSLPTTPRVSPKLCRRSSLKNEKEIEVQKAGPGFSFLESVAGQLHLKKQQHEKKQEQWLVKTSDGQKTVAKPVDMPVVSEPEPETAVSQAEPATNMHSHHLHDFSDSAGSDLESPVPAFTKSFFSWTMTKKVNVTNKESNMFSPSTF